MCFTCECRACCAARQDCRAELHGLLREEKLAGASLLILANKQDLPGALTGAQIEQARTRGRPARRRARSATPGVVGASWVARAARREAARMLSAHWCSSTHECERCACDLACFYAT